MRQWANLAIRYGLVSADRELVLLLRPRPQNTSDEQLASLRGLDGTAAPWLRRYIDLHHLHRKYGPMFFDAANAAVDGSAA